MPSRLRKFFGKLRFKRKDVSVEEMTAQLKSLKHGHKTTFITKGGGRTVGKYRGHTNGRVFVEKPNETFSIPLHKLRKVKQR